MQKNQLVELNITAVGINGEGIAREDGMVVFVKGALPGERVRAKIIAAKKSYCYAIVEERLSDSSDMRTTVPCPVFGKCGGCSVMHVSYENQLALKQELVRDTLKKVGGIECEVLPAVPSDKQLCYRNKMSLPVRRVGDKNEIGLFALSSHRIVPTDNCLLQPGWNARIISLVKDWLSEGRVRGYDEQNGSGELRHVVVREVEGHLFVTLVMTRRVDARAFAEKLREEFDSVSLFININKRRDNVILGEEWTEVFAKNKLTSVEGFKVDVHPAGFFQVNDHIRSRIYGDVAKIISGIAPECVIDAYSGAGIMTAILSKSCKAITGIEINAQASQSAEKLIRDNGIENMSVICGDVAEHIGKVVERYDGKRVAAVLDPPRSGCEQSVLSALINSGVNDIVYVSCAPATLARDLKTLSDKFELISVRPYDMFPQTMNVETVVYLKRKN